MYMHYLPSIIKCFVLFCKLWCECVINILLHFVVIITNFQVEVSDRERSLLTKVSELQSRLLNNSLCYSSLLFLGICF